MYRVSVKLLNSIKSLEPVDIMKSVVACHACIIVECKMSDEFVEVRGSLLENVQAALASLEDAGFIKNELQLSCSIRFVRAEIKFRPQDVPELSNAIIACGLCNTVLQRVNEDTYMISGATKFSLQNTVAYMYPDWSEDEVNQFVGV